MWLGHHFQGQKVEGQLVADVLNSQHAGPGATWRINTKILSTCRGWHIVSPRAQLVNLALKMFYPMQSNDTVCIHFVVVSLRVSVLQFRYLLIQMTSAIKYCTGGQQVEGWLIQNQRHVASTLASWFWPRPWPQRVQSRHRLISLHLGCIKPCIHQGVPSF